MAVQAGAKGRTARTKGISMLPNEFDDARAFEELTGIGLSEVFHRQLAPQLHAAVQVLRDAKEAGMELNRARLRDEWTLDMNHAQIHAVYERVSELVLGE